MPCHHYCRQYCDHCYYFKIIGQETSLYSNVLGISSLKLLGIKVSNFVSFSLEISVVKLLCDISDQAGENNFCLHAVLEWFLLGVGFSMWM